MEDRNQKMFKTFDQIHLASNDGIEKQLSKIGHAPEESRIDALVRQACAEIVPSCSNKSARQFSGECNNLKNPRWGAANSAFTRLLPPEYEDGVGEPKGGFANSLPQPRFVSQLCTDHNFSQNLFPYTDLFTAFGQFLSHDLRQFMHYTVLYCTLM